MMMMMMMMMITTTTMMMNDTLIILTIVKFLGVEADGTAPYYCACMDLHQTVDVSLSRLTDRQLDGDVLICASVSYLVTDMSFRWV